MGQSMSIEDSNEALVDFLIVGRHILSKEIELAFRAVDRGEYILPEYKKHYAYKSLAWKYGNLHLSAPGIYAAVLEALRLQPGMSFLNIGSGTGYLSTMAGLILKQYGLNHGIELYEDCVRHAYQCLEKFRQESQALDVFDFCEPVFAQGNCLNLKPDRQYDRVYCGAACPKKYVNFIKKFVKVNGVLVMPTKYDLLKMVRKTDTEWHVETVIPVSFATLAVPTKEEQTLCHLPDCNPLSLQELCRGNIRNRLREGIWSMHRDIKTERPIAVSTEFNPEIAFRELVSVVLEANDHFEDMTSEEESMDNDSNDSSDTTGDTESPTRNEFHYANILYSPHDTSRNNRSPMFGHYIDNDAFTTYMKQKIHQLPLPLPLKLYVNYNREL